MMKGMRVTARPRAFSSLMARITVASDGEPP